MEYISIYVNEHHIYKPACTIATEIKSLVRITFKSCREAGTIYLCKWYIKIHIL